MKITTIGIGLAKHVFLHGCDPCSSLALQLSQAAYVLFIRGI